jgi:hypothetical protein
MTTQSRVQAKAEEMWREIAKDTAYEGENIPEGYHQEYWERAAIALLEERDAQIREGAELILSHASIETPAELLAWANSVDPVPTGENNH